MLDDDSPGLGVDFVIDTAGSFAELAQLDAAMAATQANVLAEAQRIEQATSGMIKLGGATAGIRTFGTAATTELAAAAREFRSVEKTGEALVRQLERQNSTFGKTREELRGMKAETAALAAEQKGMTELAGRIRAQEAELFDKELAAARARRFAIEAEAEEKAEAAARAVKAAEAEAQAVREAAFAYDQFQTHAKAKWRDYREQQAAQAAIEAETLATQERARAEAAVIAQLRERSNLEAALARTTGGDRPRATDAGATFSALAAKAAEDEARALALSASAAKQAADEHARLAAMVRNSHAAQLADAAAAEQLRASTDPLYAATKRLNAEIAESTRLYNAGVTAPAEYARQQQVLIDRLRDAERAHGAHDDALGKAGKAARLSSNDMLNLGYQVNDLFVSLASGQKPLTVFIQQGAQIGQIAASSGVGLGGMISSIASLLAGFVPLITITGLAVGGLALFDRAVSEGIDTKKMIDGLGLTRAEIKRLEDTSVTSGDVIKATFQVMAQRVGLDMGNMKKWFGEALDWMTEQGRNVLAGLYASFVGTFRAISAVVKAGFAGEGVEGMLSAAAGAYQGAFSEANAEMKRFGKDVRAQIAANKLADLQKQANELKLDRTPKKPKVDRHAEQLARDAAAIEAQIRNLYSLADAYGVSGAAALIAEARVKAESKAIRQRGDIEAAVAREVRLAVAQRVSDAAKSTVAMRDQAAMQERVNGEVAAGNVHAALAGNLIRDRMADLPLLAALEAAQAVKDAKGIAAATEALDAQRAARDRLTDAERKAQMQAALATGGDQLAMLREELRLVGATELVRVRSLAVLRATQQAQASGWTGPDAARWIEQQAKIAAQGVINTQAQEAYAESLTFTADMWDIIADKVQGAGRGMAEAFGEAGRAIGDLASIHAGYHASRERAEAEHRAAIKAAGGDQARIDRENALFAARASGAQIEAYGDMVSAAKGFFKEGSAGYKALAAAEKVYRVAQFAMSIQAMVQNAAETLGFVANSTARATAAGAEGIATQSRLPFPANIAAMAATGAALVAAGIAVFGGGGSAAGGAPTSNTGTGTVLGDADAKSESLKRAIDQLREVDTLMLTSSRQMAASLRSIDDQIGGFAAQIVRAGNVDASSGVTTGFKSDAIGSMLGKLPVIGGILGGLFGTKTSVTAAGLYGGSQTIGDILGSGFDASTYSDVQKKKKLFGITTSTKTSTQMADADAGLERQFTLILKSFSDAIGAAAGPLGMATGEIEARLSGFVVDIGKIDLKGLTGTEIQEKLEAVFGAAADGMAEAAIPGVTRFQKAGEGAFETLVRVASTLEAVSASLDLVGGAARGMSIDAKLGLANQFDSIGDLTGAVDSYFTSYFTEAEQAAAKTAQIGKVFASLGVAMPETLAGFRALVEAQDLTSAAGQSTYATLLQLAPAFADLKTAMDGAKSAADILSERQDLERKLLELQGDTAALRALDLAKLDASNRALQQQIYAVQDAQEAAKAAEALRDAWKSVGDTILDEVKRIRGLTGAEAGGGFAVLMGQFNAATDAARGGDQDAAKSLPGISQALLKAAAEAATSRQELDRIQAATAVSLEATYGVVSALTTAATSATSTADAAATAATTSPAAANDDTASEMRLLREEVAGLRADLAAANAAIAANTGRTARKLEDVTAASGGDAISVAAA